MQKGSNQNHFMFLVGGNSKKLKLQERMKLLKEMMLQSTFEKNPSEKG